MTKLGLEKAIVDQTVYENSVRQFRDAGIVLPTFAQLADPQTIPAAIKERLRAIDPDTPDPLNLFRVHWFNADDRRSESARPAFIEIPEELSGVPARIVLALGNRFPMISAHKVLAAYGCLAPPRHHRTVRSRGPSRGLAVNRQLLPRRRGDLADHGVPRRRRPAREYEP